MLHGIEVPEIYDIQYKVFLLSLIFGLVLTSSDWTDPWE